MVNKLQPIRAYTRYTDDIKSNKRSACFSNDRDAISPYIATREVTTNANMNKIRENKIVKNPDSEATNEPSEAYNEQSHIAAKQMQAGLSKARAMNGAIMNQLQQNRWKSTLHSRGQNTAFFRHTKDGKNEKINQWLVNKDLNVISGVTESSKLTYNLCNPRSASFQPSIIRRREGNMLKNVDLQEEMKHNIKWRRQGNLNTLLVKLEEAEGVKAKDKILIEKQAQNNNKRGVKKIVLKESISKSELNSIQHKE